MKGRCLCKAIEYDLDSLNMPITQCFSGSVKKHMQRHLQQLLVFPRTFSLAID